MDLATQCSFKETEVINLGSEDEISMLNLGEEILKLMNIDSEFVLHEAPKGSVSRRRPDLAVLTRILGDRKRVDLEEGLEQTLNWYRLNRKLYKN